MRCDCGVFYVIGRGETLGEIARRHQIGLAELLQRNPYLNPAYYLPGQVILLPFEDEKELTQG